MYVLYDKYLNNKLWARKYMWVLIKSLYGEMNEYFTIKNVIKLEYLINIIWFSI